MRLSRAASATAEALGSNMLWALYLQVRSQALPDLQIHAAMHLRKRPARCPLDTLTP